MGHIGIDTRRMESPSLRLRPLEPVDMGDVLPLLTDYRRLDLFWHEPMSERRIIEWIEARIGWTTRLKSSGVLTAMALSEPVDKSGATAIHAVTSPHTGLRRGLAAEALRLLAACLIDRCGVHRIVATPVLENRGAVAALEAAGFEREGVLRDAVLVSGGRGGRRSLAVYARLAGGA